MLTVVGFDLDMTLVDSAAGIAATLVAALAEQDVAVDDAAVWPLVGLPLELMVTRLAPGADPGVAVAGYRRLYPSIGVPATVPLPGAAQALEAVRSVPGGRALVVSTKIVSAVTAVLDQVGLVADEVHGGLFAQDKATALRTAGAHAYVGDHPGDVAAARAAGAVAVAVATGPHPAAALARAGADVVLPDLVAVRDWLAERRATGSVQAPTDATPPG